MTKIKPLSKNMEKCQKCQSEMKFREGTSKAGNPYAGHFCSNKECDFVVWQESKPQPTNSDILEALKKMWEKYEAQEKLLNVINTKLSKEDIGSIDK